MMTVAMFIAAFVVSFIKGWLLTVVTLVSIPAVGLGAYIYAKAIDRK